MILGPSTPYIPYEGNNHVRTIMVKYKNQDLVRESLKKLLRSSMNKNGINLTINIDPYNL